VEDAEKLTYLDLEGCFGDLCDLRNCIYLSNRGSVSHANPDEALQRILAERWAYDDISEDEPDDEENSLVSTTSPEHESGSGRHHSSSQMHIKECSEAPQSHVSEAVVMQVDVILEDARGNNVGPQSEYLTSTQSPGGRDAALSDLPEGDDVLFDDHQVSNVDMINYYVEIARNCGDVGLKSVDGEGDEVLL
jgi:hypothetical protein